jgi:poly-gamma-glutamate capsule biosynthesis protein CapA/YwtB (metallophosphatase superfamily)
MTAAAEPAAGASVRFAGDIYVQEEHPETAFAPLFDITRAADVLIGNLEIPLCDTGEPLPKPNGHLRSEPRQVTALTAAGFAAVGVANNHAMNYGYQGLRQMLGVLDDAGIAHAGGGGGLAEASRPVLGHVAGWRYAMLSYTSVYARGMFEATADRGGLATVEVTTSYEPRDRHFEVPGLPPVIRTVARERDAARMAADVAAARPLADAVIVSWHWGVSLVSRDVVEYQRRMARAAIDAGADAVIGHHPHVLQPIEFYRGKPICYSIGNLFHALRSEHFTPESAVLELIFGAGGAVSGVRIYPLWLDRGADPVPLAPGDPRCHGVLAQLGQERTVRLDAGPGHEFYEVTPLDPDGAEDGREGGVHV